jgi:hypothetical protein
LIYICLVCYIFIAIYIVSVRNNDMCHSVSALVPPCSKNLFSKGVDTTVGTSVKTIFAVKTFLIRRRIHTIKNGKITNEDRRICG